MGLQQRQRRLGARGIIQRAPRGRAGIDQRISKLRQGTRQHICPHPIGAHIHQLCLRQRL